MNLGYEDREKYLRLCENAKKNHYILIKAVLFIRISVFIVRYGWHKPKPASVSMRRVRTPDLMKSMSNNQARKLDSRGNFEN